MTRTSEKSLTPSLKNLFGQGPVLILAARPGDEVRGCGGACMHHLESGDSVTVLINAVDVTVHPPSPRPSPASAEGASASDACAAATALGSEGSLRIPVDTLAPDNSEPLNDNLLESCYPEIFTTKKILGYQSIIIWSDMVSRLGYSEPLIERIREVLQYLRPAVVYVPSITVGDIHRSILVLSTIEAIRRHPSCCTLLMYGIDTPQQPDHFLDIALYAQKKKQALDCQIDDDHRAVKSEEIVHPIKLHTSHSDTGQDQFEAFKVINFMDKTRPPLIITDSWCQTDISLRLPLVSIIVRTTGRSELAYALASIAVQTYPNIEIILVDVKGNGCVPESEKCGHFPVKFVTLGKSLNRGEAINLGLDKATGAYAGCLDDDDWLLPNHVSVLMNALTGSNSANAAYSGVICRQENPDGSWKTMRIYNEPYDPVRLLIENYLPIHAVLFSRSLLGPNLRCDESLVVYEDWDLWIQLSLLTDFIHVDILTAVYRISSSSGFGVVDGGTKALKGLQVILDKWRPKWTIDQLVDLSLYHNRQLQISRADVAQLNQELDHAQSECKNAVVELDNARSAASSAQAEVEKMQLQLASYSIATGLHMASYSLATDIRLEELSKIISEKNAIIAQKDSIITELHAELAKYQHANGEIEARCSEYHKSNHTLEQKLKDSIKLINSLKTAQRINRHVENNLSLTIDLLTDKLSEFSISPIGLMANAIHSLSIRLPRLTKLLELIFKYSWWALTLKLQSRLKLLQQERQVLASGLFDPKWYIRQYPNVLLKGMRPALHWLVDGNREMLNPHPLFDVKWYVDKYQLDSIDFENPIFHYLHIGAKAGYLPHPLFDPTWYLEQNPELLDKDIIPLLHFLKNGRANMRSPHPLFDSKVYLRRNPDVAKDGINPLIHFLLSGARERRDPHPLFCMEWYLENNPDIAEMDVNPLVHYLTIGGNEGRSPHPLFDGAWYLATYSDIRNDHTNPLVDYVVSGAWRGRKPNRYFDSAWYLQQHPELVIKHINPLFHYIETGSGKGFDPSPDFDSTWYRQNYPDIAEANLDPFEHYIYQGMKEGRLPKPEHGGEPSFPSPNYANDEPADVSTPDVQSDYVPETPTPEAPRSPPVRLIAFYLPQFHPIPENDRWWGKGFTEWTNVSRATPQFVGHDQPRLPGALGFYDLRLPEVQAEQMRLARHYGLYGFCYYYWFGGQRLLERPLQQILADPGLDLPFCLCWANENWTRRWDGEDQEILMGQRHSAADDLALIAALEPVFRDPRYIQVDGKPLFIVYRPQILPDAAATVARWRQYAADQGLPGLFLVAAQSFSDALGADDTLFDALVEFPPHTVPRVPLEARPRLLNPHFRGELLDYRAGVTAAEAAVDAPPAKLTFPGVMTAWDNSARRREAATIFAQATPQAYGRWLSAACRRALRAPRPDQRLVFINAWNEWAEGAYLEPDQRHGFAYLHTTREVLLAAAHGFPGHDQLRLLVVGHDAHRHGAQLLTLHLLRLFARRFGYRPRLWLLGDGALRPAYEALAEVQMVTPETTAALAQHLRQEGLDRALVNTVVSAAVLPALAAAGVRSLALIHEMPQLIQERGLEANAQAVVTHANAIVFAADTVRQAFASLVPLPAERALLLPQGLYQDLSAPPTARAQVRQALGLPTDAILVLNVGYGDARKGLDLFLDAARLTHSADARFHFLWLGDIDARFQARLARERPRAGYLHQIPFTAEVAPYYAAADLFLLSSREDPFPSVVLEALGCGLPVVAFADSGGHGELLGDPLHGALSPPGDVSALSQALRDLAQAEAQAPQRRAQRAAAARARFDFVHYGWRLLRQLDPRLQAVSVIVPNYNYAAYLRPRLHSIFDQRYPLFELLVLDDASTDASREVIAACSQEAQRELRLLTNADNSGSVFAQWRQGVAQAQGELVWLAEADDVAAPPFLATLAPAFATQPDLVFAFCDSAQIDGAGQPLGDSYAAYCGDYGDLDFHQDFTVSAGRFLRQGLGVRNTVLNVSAVLFRRQALLAAMERLGPALEQWRIAGDWRLYIELCRGGGEVAYVASALNQHRRHQASVVGAHGLDRHIAEITAMHQELAPEAREDDRLARHQRDYIESLYRQAREQDQG